MGARPGNDDGSAVMGSGCLKERNRRRIEAGNGRMRRALRRKIDLEEIHLSPPPADLSAQRL
jgi:hypothetical protein